MPSIIPLTVFHIVEPTPELFHQLNIASPAHIAKAFRPYFFSPYGGDLHPLKTIPFGHYSQSITDQPLSVTFKEIPLPDLAELLIGISFSTPIYILLETLNLPYDIYATTVFDRLVSLKSTGSQILFHPPPI